MSCCFTEISEASKNMFPMQQKRAALEPPVASSSGMLDTHFFMTSFLCNTIIE